MCGESRMRLISVKGVKFGQPDDRRYRRMILGTGVDLAEVHRIRQSVERFGDRFVHRIYTDREIAYVERKANQV